RKIVERAKQNEELSNDVGYEQVTTDRKMKDGKISEQKVRLHRITWLEGKPYPELVKVNGKEPDEKEKKEEKKKKEKFIKSLREKPKKDPEDITWEDLYAKYEFQGLPADSTGVYVFSFHPKSGKLTERSKIEKVLNQIVGTFWADENFNIVRAEARLLDDVKFGLGILGILEKLEMKYEQQNYENILVPSYAYIHFKARVALVKLEERKIEATFTDFFKRPISSHTAAQ
ncbi:MAG: hypothetical protein ACRD4B_09305, partial [Acidobacteriota bacterium]